MEKQIYVARKEIIYGQKKIEKKLQTNRLL